MTRAEIQAGLDEWAALIRNAAHSTAYITRRQRESATRSGEKERKEPKP